MDKSEFIKRNRAIALYLGCIIREPELEIVVIEVPWESYLDKLCKVRGVTHNPELPSNSIRGCFMEQNGPKTSTAYFHNDFNWLMPIIWIIRDELFERGIYQTIDDTFPYILGIGATKENFIDTIWLEVSEYCIKWCEENGLILD